MTNTIPPSKTKIFLQIATQLAKLAAAIIEIVKLLFK
jgi:hypothetical protein